MATKSVKTRIKNRTDTLANWQATGVELLPGEIALVTVNTQQLDATTGNVVDVPAVLMKVGAYKAGSNTEYETFGKLPWLSALASDVYDWAKKEKAEDIPVTVNNTASTLGAYLAKVDTNASNISTVSSKVDVAKVSTAISSAINALDFEDTSATVDTETSNAANKFVTVVTQTNGTIAVQKRTIAEIDLPDISAGKIKVSTSASTSTTLTDKLSAMDAAIASNTANSAESKINSLITNQINTLNVSAPAANGTATAFIDSASQANGKIVVTKKSLPTASTSIAGITILGASGGAATHDAVFGTNGLNSKVTSNTAEIAAIKTAIAGGVHFRGTVAAKPTSNSVTVNGSTALTAAAGDIVLWAAKGIEYIYTGTAWEELGDVTRLGELETKINNLDVDAPSDATSKFVSQVTQTDGKVSVTYTRPIAADVLYASSGTDTVKSKIDANAAAIATKANSTHTHSSYVNQNAFSNIKVGSTTVAANTTTDTVEFAGSNITIAADSSNTTTDKITFTVADASTSAKGVVQLSDATNSDASTTAATSKAVKTAYDKAATAEATAAAKAPADHTHGNIKNAGIIDTTALSNTTGVGAVLVTDKDNKITRMAPATVRSLIGAGTSSLTLGTTATTAAKGNHTHASYESSISNINSTYVRYNSSDAKLYVGSDGTDVIIFDCGGAAAL